MQAGPIDLGVLGARLRQQTDLNDPFIGAAAPMEVEARSKLWPHASLWTLIELKQVTDNGARRLEEYRFTGAAGVPDLPEIHGAALPVAIMFERSPTGSSRARIYCARALLAQRAAILPVDEHLKLDRGPDDVVARCLLMLQSGQLEPSLDLFEPDGYWQHWSGEIFRTREQLRVGFTHLYQNGGINLRYCSKMDEGARTVYEVNLADGRPALAVYERGRSGKIAAVRCYL